MSTTERGQQPRGQGEEALGSAAEGTTLALSALSRTPHEPSPRERPFPDFTGSSHCAGAVQTELELRGAGLTLLPSTHRAAS